PPARPPGAAPAAQPRAAAPARAAPEQAANEEAAEAAPAAEEPVGDPEEIVLLREGMPDLGWERVQGYLELKIPKTRLPEIGQRLRDQLGYDYLSSITAVDWRDRIELVYHLYGFNYRRRPGGVVLRVDLERPELPDYPLCPSLTRLWPGAN